MPFRNELIKRGSKHLFPRLCSPDRSAIGKWSGKWSKYRIRLGITDPRKTFHSFRHTFKRACQLAGIPEEVHVALMGHAPRETARSYGGEMPIQVLHRAIQKIAYEGLDLSHLHLALRGDPLSDSPRELNDFILRGTGKPPEMRHRFPDA